MAPTIWQRLSEHDRVRFMRHLRAFWDAHRHRLPLQLMARFSRLPIPAQAVVLSLALLVVPAMGPEGVAPFIYFQF